MIERALCSAALAAGLWLLASAPKESSGPRRALAATLLSAFSWTLLAWTSAVLPYPDALPQELDPGRALLLQGAGLLFGVTGFWAAGGRAEPRAGAVCALVMGVLGWCASRWPQLSRAIELSGGTFAGPFLQAALPVALAATGVLVAAALLVPDARPHARGLVLAAAALWLAPTLGAEAALSRWWGFGPRSLAEAAGVETNRESETLDEIRLAPDRGRSTSRASARMAAGTVDASPESLAKLEEFLRRAGYRDVFAREALAAVRQGWRQWWDAERALDAEMIAAPGRAHPDYRRALDLLKAGPLTSGRYAKLQRLDAAAQAGPAGFEDVNESQYIFEGFIAAYARFGDEANARRWLARTDNLLMVSDRRIEVTPLEDFREGRISGTLTVEGRPAKSVLVGLFLVWKSSGAKTATPLLSGSQFPDEDGGFSFSSLGPGDYELGLLGRPEDLRGRVAGGPGLVTIGYDRPEARLPPIRLEREELPVPQAFAPSGLPPPPELEVPEPALRWPRR